MRVYTRSMSNASCYCIVLRKASRRISALYDEALAPLGINITQFSALRNVSRNAPISLTDLGHEMELDRSTVGRNMKVLERMGLVAFGTGKDHREAVLSLTSEGIALLQRAKPIWDDIQGQLESRLGPDHAIQLGQLLAAI
jgi:DNA-binding MarR family transcriptional regulator